MELITNLSGLLKAITHTISVRGWVASRRIIIAGSEVKFNLCTRDVPDSYGKDSLTQVAKSIVIGKVNLKSLPFPL